MRKGRFSQEQIIAILREQEAGMTTTECAAGMDSRRRRSTPESLSMAGSMCRRPSG